MFSCVVRRGEQCQTNITGACEECSQCMGHTGFAPAPGGMCFPGLHCSGRRLLCKGTLQNRPCISCMSQVQAAQVQVLRYFARTQTQLGVCFGPFPGPFPGLSSSSDQVLAEHTGPGGSCLLITSPVPDTWFPGCVMRVPSPECHVSPLGS